MQRVTHHEQNLWQESVSARECQLLTFQRVGDLVLMEWES